MRVILANPRGFCAGVNMAIDCLEKAVRLFGAPVHVYHEIVHNRYVVSRFREKGVVFIDQMEDAPVGSTVLFSAHGVSPEIRRIADERNLLTIDATCPLVTKVHLEAIKFAKEGYTIFLIGHEGHDEVIGTIGEAPDRIRLVETAEEVDDLVVEDESKVAYLTQTTLSVDDAERVIKALKKRFPRLVGPPKDDICYATQNRQEAVRALVPECDVVLVLGSQNSSNSQRLREIAEVCGRKAYLIDTAREIQPDWFKPDDTVLITAGASAPEIVVEDCLRHLERKYGATVDERVIREEHVNFPLPKELRQLEAERAGAS